MRLFRSLELPLAAKWQEQTIPFDWTLTERAREIRPTVRWWYGLKVVRNERLAWCYVCDTAIVPTSWGSSITEAARTAILIHRDLHLMGKVATPGGATASVPTEKTTNG